MSQRLCLIGFDEPYSTQLANQWPGTAVKCPALPRLLLRDGNLFVESPSSHQWLAVDAVVFHGIFENDLEFLAGLALWSGPCLPNARAMLDCRLRLACLVRALPLTQFQHLNRGFASAGVDYPTDKPRVAKWGNWHCGDDKVQFDRHFLPEHPALIEDFIPGQAVRVMIMGLQAWQINLQGETWLKSIHHPNAQIVETPNPQLIDDTRNVVQGMNLEMGANDYIIGPDGQPYFLELNHIPNVTRFAPIWDAYREYVGNWTSKIVAHEQE